MIREQSATVPSISIDIRRLSLSRMSSVYAQLSSLGVISAVPPAACVVWTATPRPRNDSVAQCFCCVVLQVVHRLSDTVQLPPVTPYQSPDHTAETGNDQETTQRCGVAIDVPLVQAPQVSLTTDDGDDFDVWFGRRGSIFIVSYYRHDYRHGTHCRHFVLIYVVLSFIAIMPITIIITIIIVVPSSSKSEVQHRGRCSLPSRPPGTPKVKCL